MIKRRFEKSNAAQAAADKLVVAAVGAAIGVACDVGSDEQVEAAVCATLRSPCGLAGSRRPTPTIDGVSKPLQRPRVSPG